jgi:hypothetical protein
MHAEFLSENLKGRGLVENLRIDGKVIVLGEGVHWVPLYQGKDQ